MIEERVLGKTIFLSFEDRTTILMALSVAARKYSDLAETYEASHPRHPYWTNAITEVEQAQIHLA